MLVFEGELRPEDGEAASRAFAEALAEGRSFVIAQMQNVTLITSPFVGVLMECRSGLVEKGGNLALVGLDFDLREQMSSLGADRIFPFYSDLQAAYRHFRSARGNLAQSISLTMSPRLSAVPAVRRLVSGLARQKGFGSKDAFRLETMVDEITNNAIEHGDPSQTSISIEMRLDRMRVELLVRNKTEAEKSRNLARFAGEGSARQGLVGNSGSRGRGLALVKLISNSFNVSIDKNGTAVRVTKLREDQ